MLVLTNTRAITNARARIPGYAEGGDVSIQDVERGENIHTTYILHIYYIYTTYILHVYYIYTTCILHVYYIYTTYIYIYIY